MLISNEKKKELIDTFKSLIEEINEEVNDNEFMELYFDTLSESIHEMDYNKLLIKVNINGCRYKTFDLMEDIGFVCENTDDPSYLVECFCLKKQLNNAILRLDEYINNSMSSIEDRELLKKTQAVMSEKLSPSEYFKWEKSFYDMVLD
jgi:hypothetical protein